MLPDFIGRLLSRSSFARRPYKGGRHPAVVRAAGAAAGRLVRAERLEGRRLLSATVINQVNGTYGSDPFQMTDVNGTTYFTAYNNNPSIHDKVELWKTDGTDAGTVLVKGGWRVTSNYFPTGLTNVGGTLYFVADDGGGAGQGLWKTNGTPAGTARVGNAPKPAAYAGRALVAVGGVLYFTADDGTHGMEVWRTDGTTAGTAMVKDINPGPGSAATTGLLAVGNTVFFSADDGTHGEELWKTDGTAAGTVMVKDINTTTPSAYSRPINLTALNGALCFAANDGVSGYELWKSDGTAAGTVLIKDLVPGSTGGGGDHLGTAAGRLYFTSFDAAGVNGFWTSDGTAAGTTLVKANVGTFFESTRYTPVNGRVVFTVSKQSGQSQVWATDGTDAGTTALRDLTGVATPLSVQPQLAAVGGTVLFAADDGTGTEGELWKTDGTSAGTVRLKDINPFGTSTPFGLVTIGGRAYFAADDGTTGRELWASDGTAAGTVRVKDVDPRVRAPNPDSLTTVGGKVFFNAAGLWVTDGTEAGTARLTGTVRIAPPSSPSGTTKGTVAVDFGGRLLFDGADGVAYGALDGELFASDGTPAGTVLVKDIKKARASLPSYLTVVGDMVLFWADDGTHGSELWRTDGTADGTQLVRDVVPGTTGSLPATAPVNVNGTLYFATGSQLYKSDGTFSGTVPVTPTLFPTAFDLTAANGLLLFAGNTDAQTSDVELWRSDGTAAGTYRLKDINPGTTGALASSGPFLPYKGGVLFAAADFSTPNLWFSDGTAGGTVKVADLGTQAGATGPRNLTDVNGTVFFTTRNEQELWRTTGFGGITSLLKTFTTDAAHAPGLLTAVNGTLFFRGYEFATGSELWRSDGTGAGTVLDSDLVPNTGGLIDASPSSAAAADGWLIFAAASPTPTPGFYLYRVETPVVPPAAPAGFGGVAVSGAEIVLAWTPGSANEAGFRLERSTDPNFAFIGKTVTLPPGTARYADTDVAPGVMYYYRLRAFNRAGESAAVTAALPATPAAPAAPTGLTATPAAADRVDLRWADRSGDEAGFRIERSRTSGFSTIEATFAVGPNVTSFSDATTAANTDYFYRVRAVNAAGVSGYAAARVLTPDAAPSGLVAVGVSSSQINLRWVDNSSTEDTFRVERASGAGTFVTIVNLAANTTTYADTSRAANTTYRYRVRAVGPTGVSGPSNEAAGETLPDPLSFGVTQPAPLVYQAGSDPTAVIVYNGVGYFAATTTAGGPELWRTDGTAAGTSLVKDIYPGSSGSGPIELTVANGVLYFAAIAANSNGRVLWKTDGTAAGTVQVQSTGTRAEYIQDLVVLNNTLYFRDRPSVGISLWKTDGTATGTVVVRGFAQSNGPRSNMINVNGALYFSAFGDTESLELWKSDGTTAGTVLLKDCAPGGAPSSPLEFVNVGGTLYFTAQSDGSVRKLWKSDGTTAGTVEVPGSPDTGNSSQLRVTAANGLVFFLSGTASELWRSNGTAAGTFRLLTRAQAVSDPNTLTPFAGKLYFNTTDNGTNTTLWATDGTVAGSVPVKTFAADRATDAGITEMKVVGGALYFAARSPTQGWLLYKSDGSAGGTVAVAAFPGDARPAGLGDFAGTLLLGADDGAVRRELWRSNGTAAGTTLVKDINTLPPAAAHPDWLTTSGGKVYFTSSLRDGKSQELWVTDGTPAGTTRLFAAPASNLFDANGTLYFAGYHPASGIELWKTDGTVAGTVRVSDVVPGPIGSSPKPLGVVNGKLVFGVTGSFSQSIQLWTTDGTPGGTARVPTPVEPLVYDGTDIYKRPSSAVFNGVLYFVSSPAGVAADASGELWRTDGTGPGTYQVKDIYPGGAGDPYGLTVAGNALYFVAYDAAAGHSLWKTDGSAAGTVLVKDLDPTRTYSNESVVSLTNVNGTIFFSGYDGVHGREVWKSDGTAAGTVMVADLIPGGNGIGPVSLTAAGGTLFFIGYGGAKLGLYKSDGTAAGTVRLADIDSVPRGGMTAVGGTVFFGDSFLWRSDGTPEGTVQVGLLGYIFNGGIVPVNGPTMVVVGDRVFFVHMTDSSNGGEELRVANATPPAAPTGVAVTAGPGTSGLVVRWADNSNSEAGFIVQRSARADFSVIDFGVFVPADATIYADVTALGGTYYYRVRAANAGGNSAAAGGSVTAPVPGVTPGAGAAFTLGGSPAAAVLTLSAGSVTLDPVVTAAYPNLAVVASGGATLVVTGDVRLAGLTLDGPTTTVTFAGDSPLAGLTFSGGAVAVSVPVASPPGTPTPTPTPEPVPTPTPTPTPEPIPTPVPTPPPLPEPTPTPTPTPVPLPALTINDVAAAEGRTGVRPFVFAVTLSRPAAGVVKVRYATANVTAAHGTDYAAAGGWLTFRPGQVSKTVTVQVTGDTRAEADETFRVILYEPSGATVADGTGVGNIRNDDTPAPRLSVGDAAVSEGNAGTRAVSFDVTLDRPAAAAVTVKYATADGSAKAGSDYAAAAGTLTFKPGETRKRVTVYVKGDKAREADEAFFLNLLGPVNAGLGDDQGRGVIKNDD